MLNRQSRKETKNVIVMYVCVYVYMYIWNSSELNT